MYKKIIKTSRVIILGSNIEAYSLAIYCAKHNIDVILINSGNNFSLFNKNNEHEFNCDTLIKIEKEALSLKIKIIYDIVNEIDYCDKYFILFGNNFKYKTYLLIVDFSSLNINLYKFNDYLNKFDNILFDSFYYKNKNIAIIGDLINSIRYVESLVKFGNILHLISYENKITDFYIFKNIFKNIYNIKLYYNHTLLKIKKNFKTYNLLIINNKNKQKINFNVEKYYLINNLFNINLYKIENYVKLNNCKKKYFIEKNGFFKLSNNLYNYYGNKLVFTQHLKKKIITFLNYL